ncbi:MAG: aminoglycoside phosphotransferase family protein [Bdellovibrionales bacterium]
MNLDTKNFITEKLNIDFKLTPLTGDAGTRQYFKIKNDMKNKYILCAYKKDELTSFDYFLNVNTLFTNQKIKTPEILHTSKHLGLMILEDLGDVTLEDAFKDSYDLTLYKQALNELIKIQSIPPQEGSIAHSYAFTVKKFDWEFNFSLEHLTNLYSLDLTSIDIDTLKQEFTSISSYLFNLPQVVTHRDFHSRNLINKTDGIYVIDFQDARMGNPFYDLTSLIEDTYTGLSAEQKEILTAYYKEQSSLEFDEEFSKSYSIQALQRSIKACGSFAWLKNVIGTDRYIQYIKPSLINIKRFLNDLNTYPELTKFVNLCAKEEGL